MCHLQNQGPSIRSEELSHYSGVIGCPTGARRNPHFFGIWSRNRGLGGRNRGLGGRWGACAGRQARKTSPGAVRGLLGAFPTTNRCFRPFSMELPWVFMVLHGYRHFYSTARCCCGRQSPKVKNLKIRGFEHFFSPASDRFGRLSSRFRAPLGWVKKTLY